jgi:hypothetical protein
MNITLFAFTGFLPALLFAPLTAQGMDAPVLSTPGTATWATEVTATGSRTVFTITGNTVLDWGQFNLASGSELVFDFAGGENVANMLGGSGANIIAGKVASNGNLAFFSPGADLLVTGSVTGKSVTLAAMSVDPSAASGGGVYTLQGAAGGAGQLVLSGSVQATGGDVVLAGSSTQVFGGAKVNATGSVLMAAAAKVTVDPGSSGPTLKAEGGEGFVLHMGETRAARIEIAASVEIQNGGRLDVGSKSQRIFLEVGNGGRIRQTGTGIMVGAVTIDGKIDRKGDEVSPHEGDSASVLSDSTLRMPRLKRPDGSTASGSRTIVNNAPMSASADGGRDRKGPEARLAQRDKPKPLLQRASFFGIRGGSVAKPR